jgi:hypothetical protein
LCAADFHRSSPRLVVCVSVVADVCILSGGKLKVNRFSGKDVEVFLGSKNRSGRWAGPEAASSILPLLPRLALG